MSPEVVFKAVDIDENLFKEELFYIRTIYWQLQSEIRNEYDFGLVLMDCTPFKKVSI